MRVLKRLAPFIRPYLAPMLAGVVLLALAGALMSALLATVGPLVNHVLSPPAVAARAQDAAEPIAQSVRAASAEWTERIGVGALTAWTLRRPYARVPLLIVLVFFVRAVALYFGQYFTTRAGFSVVRDLRAKLHASITFQSLRFFQLNPTGTLVARVLGDVQRLQRVCTDVLADFVRVGTMIPAILVVILIYDWRMSLVALIALPLLGFPLVRLGKRLRRASTRSQESMGDVASLLTETAAGARVVQGFSMERFEIARFRAALDRMLRADLKAGRAAALAPAVLELLGGIAAAAIFFFAGRGIAHGRVDPGNFTVVLMGLGTLFMSVRRMNQLHVEMQQAAAAATRVFEILDRPSEIEDAAGATALPPFTDAIRFEGVRFAYEDGVVLDGIDLTIRKGELVALVGASGAGKTTLAHLILRFYDPTEGRITVDGKDLRHVTLGSLRGQIGLVTQETVLFDESVRNNIAYGRTDVPLARITAAAQAAQAHEFVEGLPQGYDTVLGERGSRLSMGQRQRLTIARALVKDPPILILDEATSALDSESETLVQQALEVLMRGRTSVVIAHRLATVRGADRIVVLDAGRIVEEGTHRALLDRGGAYARLYDLQFRESPA